MAGTTWKFKSEITYDEATFDQFDYFGQTGWDEFPEGTYMSNGSYKEYIHGLTITPAFGYNVFGPVFPGWQEWTFDYCPENDLGIPSGWLMVGVDFSYRFLEGEVTDPLEVLENMKSTSTPMITFPPQTNATLENPALIQWFYNNAELQ
mgnify:CR=1 FL=1